MNPMSASSARIRAYCRKTDGGFRRGDPEPCAAPVGRVLAADSRPAAHAGARGLRPAGGPLALGYLSLIEVRRDPLRFYFRLDGTKQVDLFGIDCTRRYLDEAMPGDHAAMAVASVSEAWSAESRVITGGNRVPRRLIEDEIVILRSSDGVRVDLLMTGIVPDRPL